MGNKRRQARIRFHQERLAQEEEEDQKKALLAEKKSVRQKRRDIEGRKGENSVVDSES